MNTKSAMHSAAGFGALALVLAWACLGHADSIVVDGVKYDDVLVYQSSSMYYVRLPREGRTLSVPADKVDDSQVTISDDPYYRDELKERFDSAKDRAEGGRSEEPSDPAFKVPKESAAADIDTSALLGGGGPGATKSGGSGVVFQFPRQQVTQMLTSQGMTASKSGNAETISSPDGNFSMTITGPGDQVTGVDLRVTAPELAIRGSMTQIGMMTASSAAWIGSWLRENQETIFGGGSIQKSQDGIAVSVTTSKSGENLSLNFAMSGA